MYCLEIHGIVCFEMLLSSPATRYANDRVTVHGGPCSEINTAGPPSNLHSLTLAIILRGFLEVYMKPSKNNLDTLRKASC